LHFYYYPSTSFFFTESVIGATIQYILAAILIIHDIDEKKWGVDVSRKINTSLASMDLTKKFPSIPVLALNLLACCNPLFSFKNKLKLPSSAFKNIQNRTMKFHQNYKISS